MIGRLDGAVIVWLEKACRRWQRLTGHTNFTLARAAHILAVLLLGLGGLYGSRRQETWLISGAIGSFAWMYCTIMWSTYSRMEEFYRDAPEVAHPVTLMWRSMVTARIVTALITLAVLGLGIAGRIGPAVLVLWYVGAACCWLAAQYLQCAIPLPPGGSKVRQLLEQLRIASSHPLPSAV